MYFKVMFVFSPLFFSPLLQHLMVVHTFYFFCSCHTDNTCSDRMSSQYLLLHSEYTTYILSTFMLFGVMVRYLDHAACSVGVGNSKLSFPVLWEECVIVNYLLSFCIFT